MSERLVSVSRALSGSEADLLGERLSDELSKQYGIDDVTLLLVDYRLGALVPLDATPPAGLGDQPGEDVTNADREEQAITRPGDPAWRSFDHEADVDEGGALYLPLTMRGDRIGVLRLSPAPADREVRAELALVATLLAHELAAVRGSTDRYTVAARTRRLTLAAEMQWELLPGRSRTRSSFALAGQLEPAYAVRGDSFDWTDDGHRLWLSAVNGSGEGVAAATLTSLATFALRNARRAGLTLADQAALADQAVYARYRGDQHLAALLIELDLASGEVTIIDAGSPRMLLLRDGEVADVELEAQLPLGMFDGTIYHPQRFDLLPGDRLFVVSDGVFDAINRSGGKYGDASLARFIRRTRQSLPLDAVRALLGELRAHVAEDLGDDAVAVCLDWSGVPPT